MKSLILLLSLSFAAGAAAKPQSPIQWETRETKKTKATSGTNYQFDFTFWSVNGPAKYEVTLRTLPNSVLQIVSKSSLSFPDTAADKKITVPITVKLGDDKSLPNTLVIDVTQNYDGIKQSESIPLKVPVVKAAAPEKQMQKSK